MYKLTRFLYNEQEVKLSFISAMLKKRDILECYYWIFELYYSNIDIFEIIFELYFDYYALLNKHMLKYIIKKYNLWLIDKDIKNIFYIIKNLHILQYDSKIFLMRQLCYNDIYPTIIKINHHKKPCNYLIRSIKKQQLNNICFYLTKFLKIYTSFEVYEQIKPILCNLSNIDIFLKKSVENTLELFNEKKYNIDLHYLLYIILNNYNEISEQTEPILQMNLYLIPSEEDINLIQNIEIDEIPLNKYNNKQIYKTLYYKRTYIIDDNIGSFNLNRYSFNSYDEFKKEILINWEYYASFNSLWNIRINKYNGIIVPPKNIYFENDDDADNFYNIYGFEFDEQDKETIDCSLKYIEKKDYAFWISHINTTETYNLCFPENFILYG